jgi:predicted enzyme related to lactoylglutathione lyase
MERVTGIGGMFFKARDPDALAHWYAEHLGVDRVPTSHDERAWWQEPGPTAFAPFPADTDSFGRPDQAWKLNFRVRDLDAMITQLRQAGIEVTADPETYPIGRFATTTDPEGNPIELWEPTPAALQEPPATPR